MIRVLLADDHLMVRKGLKQILEGTADIMVSNEVGNGPDVLKKCEKEEYDVVLLDILMPGMSGLDVLKQLKISRPGLKVLILSMYAERQYATRCLKAGAWGYLTKENAPEELIVAIRKVSSGRKYISASLAEELADGLDTDPDDSPHKTLSDREFQVVRLIASGKTVKEVAASLSLSVKTISTYRRRALEKMRMKNNAELMRYMIERGLTNG